MVIAALEDQVHAKKIFDLLEKQNKNVIINLVAVIRELCAELTEAEAALFKHGTHSGLCQIVSPEHNPCKCGLVDATSRLAAFRKRMECENG